jgi:hypothetical protein
MPSWKFQSLNNAILQAVFGHSQILFPDEMIHHKICIDNRKSTLVAKTILIK